MEKLTVEQKEQIRKLVDKELSPEQTKQLKDSWTAEQASQVRFEVMKASFRFKPETRLTDIAGIALLVVGVLMFVFLYFLITNW